MSSVEKHSIDTKQTLGNGIHRVTAPEALSEVRKSAAPTSIKIVCKTDTWKAGPTVALRSCLGEDSLNEHFQETQDEEMKGSLWDPNAD